MKKMIKFIAICVLCTGLVACAHGEEKILEENQADKPVNFEHIMEVEEKDIPDVKVETKYCDLFFAGKWKDSITYEIMEGDYESAVVFYGNCGELTEKLFAIYFGGTDGIPVGVYETAEGYLTDVTMKFFEILQEGKTAEEADMLCAMQEQVNYLLAKLQEDTAFRAVQ